MNENLRSEPIFAASFTKNKIDMTRTVLTFGLISGLIVSAFMATTMIIAGCFSETNYTLGMIIGFSSMIVAFSFVFVGIKSLRDKQLGGNITFWKATGAGLLIALIASVMYVITWAIVYKNYMPDFMDKFSADAIEEAKKSLTGQELADKINDINEANENYKKPVYFFIATLMEIYPVGILVTLVSAAILRRKAKFSTQ